MRGRPHPVGGAVAAAVAVGAPFAAVLLPAALFTAVGTVYRPAQGALLPLLARTPEQMAAASAVASAIDNAAFLVGALAGGAAIAALSAEVAFGATALVAMLCGLVLATIPRDAPPPHRDSQLREALAREALGGFRTVGRHPQLRLVVILLTGLTLVEGIVDVLVVLTAIEVLDAADAAVGWLNAGWGLGGLLGGAAALTVLARGRIAAGLSLGILLIAGSLPALGAWPTVVGALVLLTILGVGYVLVEIAGYTLLQRMVPDDVLGRSLGVLESTYVAATGAGSVLAPVLVALLGVEGGLIALGAALFATMLAARPRLARFERAVRVPERAYGLLRGLPLFAPLPVATVENLALRAEPVAMAAGEVIVREGEPGDRFYVVDEGQVAISFDTEARHVDGPCAFFGEIAVLRDVPRTATVTAATPGRLLSLGREDFLGALGAHPRSHAAAETVADARLGRASA